MDTQSPYEGSSIEAGAQDPQPSSASPARPNMGAGIIVLAVAGVLMGAGAVALVMARAPRDMVTAAPAPVVSTASAPSAPASAAAVAPTPRGPRWSGGVEKVDRYTRVTYFEVAAENEISVWTRRVRPVLSVRCVGGSTEAYVLTESAAAMEESKGSHSISVAFDDGAPLSQAWFPSDDYKALFSPDAVAFARQVAGARTLRFGFTPYGAAPAVAEFDVRGFDRLIGQVAKSCRWKP